MATLDEKKRGELAGNSFAFPTERKLPLNDAAHVRNASARFNQVEGVTATEKTTAKGRIEQGVKLSKRPD